MKFSRSFVGLMFLGIASLVLAQIPNVNLANSILEARQKNGVQMTKFTWTVQTQVLKDNSVKDTRIQQVSYGPGGVPQYALLNDFSAPLPRGFLRRAIAENEKEQLEGFLKGLQQMIGQYTLPSPGAVVNFLTTAAITQATAPDGSSILQTTGAGVVTPGDSMTISFNNTTFQPVSMNVSTTFKDQPVTFSATFRSVPGGPNHMQYTTVTVPGMGLVVNVHNYDYVPNN